MDSSSSAPSHTVTTKTVVSHYDQSGKYLGSDTKYETETMGGPEPGGGLFRIALYVVIIVMLTSLISQIAFLFVPLAILVRFVLNFWRR